MSFDELKAFLTVRFGPEIITGEQTAGLQPALFIDADRIVEVCFELRNNPVTYFDFLACLTGVDNGVEAGDFSVVYNLTSIPYKTQITLKVSRKNNRDLNNLPSFPSLTPVYKTAGWHEREAYDLLGIYFEGHPDLRRILLPDDWEGFPLRKDYKHAEFYKGISID